MSYRRRTWQDRNSQYPYRRLLTDITGTNPPVTVDVSRAEGDVTTQGDPFSANNMNDLEGRIANEFTALENMIPDTASDIDYDNTGSGMSATNVQDALDELAAGGGGGGASTLAALTDTRISNPSNGQVLTYNATNSKWENANPSGGTSENYVVITYTTSKTSYDSGVVASDFTKTSIVDQDGNAVSDGDVYGLIFSDGYGARLALVYSNTTYTVEMSHKVYTVPSGYSLSFPLFDVKISNNPAIIRTEIDVAFTGNVFSLIYEEYDYAPLASPAFTGTPTAPTPTAGDDSQKIATTAFIQDAIEAATQYKANEEFALTGGIYAGSITGGSKNIYFFIPLPKKTDNVTNVAVSGNWYIRGVSGHILSNATLASAGTVTPTLVAGGVQILLEMNTAHSTLTNTPLTALAWTGAKLKFT